MPKSVLRTLALAASLASTPAFATDHSVSIRVSFAGLPVGALAYTVRLSGSRYTIDGTGETGGVARVATKASAAFRSRGRLGSLQPRPVSHSLSYRDGKKEGTASIRFSGGRAVSATETPEPKPRKDRVKVATGMLRGVLDPTSALMLSAAADADLSTICNRTLKLYDARSVFELRLSPYRKGRLKDGTRTHTCSARYVPVAGHRKSSSSVERFRKRKGIRMTFAPLPTGAGEPSVWALVGFRVPTRLGTATGRASRIDPV